MGKSLLHHKPAKVHRNENFNSFFGSFYCCWDLYLPTKNSLSPKQISFCCQWVPSYPQKYFSNIYMLKSLRYFDVWSWTWDKRLKMLCFCERMRCRSCDKELKKDIFRRFCVYMHNTLMPMFGWFLRISKNFLETIFQCFCHCNFESNLTCRKILFIIIFKRQIMNTCGLKMWLECIIVCVHSIKSFGLCHIHFMSLSSTMRWNLF